MKLFKISTVILIPLLFLSGVKPDYVKVTKDVKLVGSYSLRSTGTINSNFTGDIVFETSEHNSNENESFSTLKLKLVDYNHSMDFLISKKNASHKISPGTYKVTNDSDGFLNYFEGVFGYANIDESGEMPFFTSEGEIKIKYIDSKTVHGFLKIDLDNANNESIHIEGNFIAKK